MQAAGMTHRGPAVGRFHISGIRNRCRSGRRAGSDHAHQRLSGGDRPTVAAPVDAERVTVLDDQHRDDGLAVALENVEIEFDERLSGAHRLAFGDARREAFALEQHGVDADVQQHAHAVRGFKNTRVMRAVQLRDDAVTRRVQDTGARIDGQAVAEHAPGEHRIGHRLDRNDDTTCKSRQLQPRKTHQSLHKPRPNRRRASKDRTPPSAQ